MILELGLIAAGVVLAAYLLWSHYRQLRALDDRRATRPLARYPGLTVIRPIRGLDADAEQNIAAALNHGYPGRVETVFVLDDDSEPALPLVREAIQEHREAGRPGQARVVLCGQPPAGRTGKLNAMIAGLRGAKGELIAFADSDIRPGARALRVLVETLLSRKDAGSAFAPVAVVEAPATVGDVGYALLLNGMYGPAAAAAASRRRGELPFIMGQFMVLRRSAIEAIGGLESAEGQLVDDMYLGMRVEAAGLRNLVAPVTVPIIQRGMGTREFAKTFLRWITFSRSGLPGLDFKLASWLQGVAFWGGLIASVVALSQGLWLAALLTGLAPLGVAWQINVMHHEVGGARLGRRHFWVSFALLLVAPVIYFSIFFGSRQLEWRGRIYNLAADSRLAAGGGEVEDAPQLLEPQPQRTLRRAA